MAYDANMTSIAKSMRSIALVFWCFFWLTVGLLFLSFASWLLLAATIDREMRQAGQEFRREMQNVRR